MKRKLFIAVVLMAVTGVMASAQLKFGVRAGFNSSEASIKEVNTKSIAGYHVGLAAQIDLPTGFAFQTGLSYQTKGLKADSPTINSAKTKYGYLEVPLQIQWGLDLILLRPYVLLEGYGGYALDSKESVVAQAKNKWEYGYAYGFGADIMNFQVAVKYFRNLGKLENGAASVAGAIAESKNNFGGIAISVVYFF